MAEIQTNNRNNSIDFFRFFFMILICIHHYGGMIPSLVHGYMGVEFFFIVSGVFLYKSFKKQQLTPLEYLIQRVKRLWGKYFIALLFFWCVYLVWMAVKGVDFSFWNYFARLIPDSLLLQGTGLFPAGLNSPTWYVSTLVVSSALLFCLLNYNRDLTVTVICPLFCLLGYSYLTSHGTFDVYFQYSGGIFIPLVRALSGLSLGILLSSIVEMKNAQLIEKHKVYDGIGLVSFILLFVFLFSDYYCDGINYSDSILLLLITIVVLNCLIDGSIFQKSLKRSIWGSLGGVTYEMLLLHAPIMIIVNYLRKYMLMNDQIWLALYLIIVVISSYCFKMLYMYLTQHCLSNQSKQ